MAEQKTDAEIAVDTWFALRDELEAIRERIKIVEESFGFKDVRDCGHYDGTNMREYKCTKCGREWLCSAMIACSKCYPEISAAIQKHR